ncbi:DHS-like NAD/FAD-binding domain-containing protein [Sporormia fimetaria CBS 119925]|uniref:DHS-like NAD/FAD-binding domain-containing protein n=1 Tax=Sporormia fimetaria CBS 119925 TaxID=1340428 RepID=A0A6A6VNH4_9PLEO|nr:DHS-like NAD/FAD-binding domain-containing protein [Sporormia fimetaria CBS 119925]
MGAPNPRPLLRIPYTTALPPPTIIPASAATLAGAVDALVEFLTATLPFSASSSPPSEGKGKTLILTGAGLSTPSGLADYRGPKGTYMVNTTYKPIYYHEFCASHEARKRYWARSFLGWPVMERARANGAHRAVGELVKGGWVEGVVTQNVDSLHTHTLPSSSPTPLINLHGTLSTLTCLTCASSLPRTTFQQTLTSLNPTWTTFQQTLQTTGALSTESPSERAAKGLRTNPDGDVDVPGLSYTSFRYPACPTCVSSKNADVKTDNEGAWILPEPIYPTPDPASSSSALSSSSATTTALSPKSPDAHTTPPLPGILKPSVIMFGESIPGPVKQAAERLVDSSARLLVVGTSLATYSAWRLVKRARDQGKPIAVVNMGGVRGEEALFGSVCEEDGGVVEGAVRCSLPAEEVLPALVKALEGRAR